MEFPTRKWMMIIDLDKCNGCGACVIACHAENNVPFQNDYQNFRGRSMQWIRIERYWEGEFPNIKAYFLPVLCQQCKRAPCEPVCPVYAAVHSDRENMNLQVYNRCVGTRYCQNNDPYKVRFFNYYDPYWPEPLNWQLNPDVTVRTAGIMEKCTFCVQRLRRAEEEALVNNTPIGQAEPIPACVQTCPTGALMFGDAKDPNSPVAALMDSPRGFRLLEELGTEPQIIYLKWRETYEQQGS